MSASSLRTLFALFLLVIIWAYSWIIMKQMMLYADPFDFAAMRYFGGALVLFLFLLLTKRPLAPPPFWPTFFVGLAQTAAFQGLAQWALVSGGAGKVSLFCYTMPFWVVFLAWWWLKEKPSQQQWLGISAAIVGLFFVISPWQGMADALSITLAILAGVAWAIGTVLTKKLFQQQQFDAISFTAWQMLLGASVLVVFAFFMPSATVQWTMPFIWGLLYSVVLASSFGWVLWSIIIKNLPTAVASLSGLLVPITAILLAWLLLNEQPTLLEAIGIMLIIAGLFVIRPNKQVNN